MQHIAASSRCAPGVRTRTGGVHRSHGELEMGYRGGAAADGSRVTVPARGPVARGYCRLQCGPSARSPSPGSGIRAAPSTAARRDFRGPVGPDPARHHRAAGAGPCSVTQLGAPYDVSAPAISKHLARARTLRPDRAVESRPRALLPARRGAAGRCRFLDRAAPGVLGAANSTRSANISTGRISACDPPSKAGRPE